jgi:Xaa-Pro aminopeptidase
MEGDVGYQLDSLIRQHLWSVGFDYPGIGTGGSVTHGLGVIKGGAKVSGHKSAGAFGLKEGMIISIGSPRLPPQFHG